jgi:hypothetical protein
MMFIQIEESKLDKMSEYAEKMLKYGGKLMSCIEEMSEESGMGERGRMNYRDEGRHSYGRYGNRGGYGNREDDDDEEYEHYQRMNERRRRDSMGRYR